MKTSETPKNLTGNRERVVAYLTPAQIAELRMLQGKENMKNDSEFISNAVTFYSGYLQSQNASTFLCHVITDFIEVFIGNKLRYIQTNLYRLAVEIDMMMHLIAATVDVDDKTLEALRKTAEKDVQRMRGNIKVEKAMRFQRSDEADADASEAGYRYR